MRYTLATPDAVAGRDAVTFDNLHLARDGAVAVITLDRPAVLNALSIPLLTELDQALAALRAEPGVRALVITGAGDRAFAAGADIRELSTLTPETARAHATFGQNVFTRLERFGRPVIAAINGVALGGGCELAMACTFRIASDTARLGQPEISLGLMPGFGATERLPRLVGVARALDLLLTGRLLSAGEALTMGLVDRVVTQPSVLNEARAMAHDLAARAPLAVSAVLEAVYGSQPAGDPHSLESVLFARLSGSADAHEGLQAFLDKRSPTFTGR